MNKIRICNGNLYISFSFNKEIVTILQQLPERRFDRYTKEWIVPEKYFSSLFSKLEKYNFIVEGKSFEKQEKIIVASKEFKIKDSEIIITFPYDKDIVNFCRTLPCRSFNQKTKAWHVPKIYYKEIKPQLLAYGFKEVGKEAKKQEKKSLQEIENNYKNKIKKQMKLSLRDYQEEALYHSLTLDSYGLFLQQRVGKTPTAIAYILYRMFFFDCKKTLFICENTLLFHFLDEFKEWTDLNCVVIIGNKKKRLELLKENYDVYIVNYDSLRILTKELIVCDFDIIIADESQNFKNGKSQKTKAGIKIGENAKHKLILTGTPITKAPEDFYYQFAFLDKSYLGFKYFFHFLERYCIRNKWKAIIGYKNLDELQKNTSKYSYRLTRKQVRNDLPDKIYEQRYITPTIELKKQYKQMQEDLILEIENEENVKASILLVKMLRLAQITSGHFLQGKNPKLKETINIIENTEEKVTIWCKFRDSISLIENELEKKGYEVFCIHGDIKAEQRNKNIDMFNRSKKQSIIIIQISTGKVGIDLSNSSAVIFYENDYNFGNRVQAEDRNQTIHKDMKTNVIYYDLIMKMKKKSIDEYTLEIINKKQKFSDILVDNIKELLT